MTHIHPQTTTPITNYGHRHAIGYYTSNTACGFAGAPAHKHGITDTVGGGHYHDITIVLGPADGDSNYATHTHSFTIVSMGAAYGALCNHDHDPIQNTLGSSSCSKCVKVGTHTHINNNIAIGNTDITGHTHSAPPNGTSNTPFILGTKRNHYHTCTFTPSGADAGHSHIDAGTTNAGACAQAASHSHTAPGSTPTTTHTESGSIAGSYGGERRRALRGVGN